MCLKSSKITRITLKIWLEIDNNEVEDMRKEMLKGEGHKKGGKHDGIKPKDRPLGNKKNSTDYKNFETYILW